MRISGKAVHSGGDFADGMGAIEELAREMEAVHALTGLARGVTLNVRLVRDGQSANTVAPWAKGEIDLRYIERFDRDDVIAQPRAIVARSHVLGTKAELEIEGALLPLRETAAARNLLPGGSRQRIQNQR